MGIVATDFPVWVRTTHWINALFIGLMMRAGIQILAAYPRLYWNDHCTPGSEWLSFATKDFPRDRLWTALDMEEEPSVLLAQPGGNNLGLGRHWHFFGAVFWIANGLAYVILLFATDSWRRLVPTSWSIFPHALDTLHTYIMLHKPPASAFHPFDPLQQLTYFAVIFLLGPFLILTGAAQSPTIEARFPHFALIFGGRQGARSLHFIGLVLFALFTLGHTILVLYTGPGRNFGDIILGQHEHDTGLAIVIAVVVIIAILAIYALTSLLSRRSPRRWSIALGAIFRPIIRLMTLQARSRQQLPRSEVSPYLIVNGYPPRSDEEYERLRAGDFADWRLRVHGLVEQPREFSLADLKELPAVMQITKHHCIQGWCGIAAWRGVALAEVLKRCRQLPQARYVVFRSYQRDAAGRRFYETLDTRLIDHPQTILAYEMNDQPLTVEHGAPLRLRVETQLGFKMVKWLHEIELVEDYRSIGDGMGGSREDLMHYEQAASI